MTRPLIFATLDRRAALRAAATVSRKNAKPYRILNATADEAEVRIYEEIAWYAINAEEFARELATITAPVINLRINSPGGSVFDGLAIYQTLRAHSARIVTHIDGLAASIASVIALAGDEIRIAAGAFVMIHNPWSIVMGDAAVMRQEADVLEKVAASLAGMYAARTRESAEAMQELMDAETWWNAEEAIAAGYADSIADDKPANARAADRFDLSLFAKVPPALQSTMPTTPPKLDNIRDFEAFLRDAGGFSHAAAKRIAAAGFKPTSEPRDEDESGDLSPLATVASDLRSLFTSR